MLYDNNVPVTSLTIERGRRGFPQCPDILRGSENLGLLNFKQRNN